MFCRAARLVFICLHVLIPWQWLKIHYSTTGPLSPRDDSLETGGGWGWRFYKLPRTSWQRTRLSYICGHQRATSSKNSPPFRQSNSQCVSMSYQLMLPYASEHAKSCWWALLVGMKCLKILWRLSFSSKLILLLEITELMTSTGLPPAGIGWFERSRVGQTRSSSCTGPISLQTYQYLHHPEGLAARWFLVPHSSLSSKSSASSQIQIASFCS